MIKNLKVLVVDDHPIFLKGLVDVLSEELENATIFANQSSVDALNKFEIQQPDIAIIDLDMPFMNGLALSDALKLINPGLKIIILTMHKEPDIIRSVIAKGINGFVFKDDTVIEITTAIKYVLQGKEYISDQTILHQSEDENEFLTSLTKTECLVMKHIANQKSSKEIADMLFVSIKTIENHRSNISKKIQLKGSNSLLKFAMTNKKYFG